MKKIFLPTLLLFSFQSFALTNAEIRNAIQTEVVDLMTVPMQVDQATKMTDVYVSTRGIVYEYDISIDQDALGDISTTSFFPAKPLGCYGDGGAVFTNNKIYADKIRMMRIHGQNKRYHHKYIGIGGRLDTI